MTTAPAPAPAPLDINTNNTNNDSISCDNNNNGASSVTGSNSSQQQAKRMDTHPFARTSNVEVMWNEEPKLAVVIDRTSSLPFKYYVHYRGFNRRMDEWVGVDRIVGPPSVANAKLKAQLAAEKAAAAASAKEIAENNLDEDEVQRTTRRQKRALSQSNLKEARTKTSEKDRDTQAVGGERNDSGRVITVQADEMDEHEGLDEESLREHEEVTKVKNVARVELGKYQMEAWYFSPIPKEMLRNAGMMVEVLYVCEFTLNFFTRKEELLRFQAKHNDRRHPPGNEIYRDGKLSMFEVDGAEEKIYSQNLCYIAKLFLDHKTLYFDVDPFLFYVLCEVDNRGFHPVGYFSKEKYSDVGYNLACILTFPSHQRKGYGRFLIDFSYELTKKEDKVGSPEKPMSDLGQQAYKPYWTSTIVDFLRRNSSQYKSLSIMEMSIKTSIMAEDIIFTLNQLGILKVINGVYFIAANEELLEKLAQKHPVKNPRVDPNKLHWTPYLTDIKRDKFSIYSKKSSVDRVTSNITS